MTRPLILQVLYSGLGGHAAVAQTLIEGGGTNDPWDHHLLFYGIEPVAGSHIDSCAAQNIPWDYVAAHEGKPRAAWPELQAAIRRIQPDAIVLHSIKTVMPMWRVAGKIPLIAVEHQPNALKSKSEWIASVAAQWLADKVVLLSPDYHKTMARRLGPMFRPTRTALVPTGITLDPFQIAHQSSLDQTVRIGMAARFSPTKTQEVLVAALGQLIHTSPDRNWRLSLAGDGVRHDAVAQIVQDLGLSEHVELPGYLSSDALPDWFASLDLYAHSSDGETLSTSLLQAMAAGLPVIASDVAGISDLLGPPAPEEAPLGRLVTARNSEAFADAIAIDAADPETAQARAARAQAHVLRHHSPEAMRVGYAALLDGLI